MTEQRVNLLAFALYWSRKLIPRISLVAVILWWLFGLTWIAVTSMHIVLILSALCECIESAFLKENGGDDNK